MSVAEINEELTTVCRDIILFSLCVSDSLTCFNFAVLSV